MGCANVLIVDDAPVIRMMLRSVLEEAGYCVQEAADGEEALQLAERRQFDACVVDVFLPKIGGLTLIEALTKRFGGERVVAISGGETYDATAILELVQPLRVAKALPKPIDADVLLATLADIPQRPAM